MRMRASKLETRRMWTCPLRAAESIVPCHSAVRVAEGLETGTDRDFRA